jgi:hypothetical protein
VWGGVKSWVYKNKRRLLKRNLVESDWYIFRWEKNVETPKESSAAENIKKKKESDNNKILSKIKEIDKTDK